MNDNSSVLLDNSKEVDLIELISAIWKGKWLILAISTIFAISSVFYALSLPNVYRAQTILAPSSSGESSGLAKAAAQLGGLASLAGINIGSSGSDDKAIVMAILQSRQFINAFIKKHDLLVPLMAVEKWDKNTDTLVINRDLYDPIKKVWLRDPKEGLSANPTDWESYKWFMNNTLGIKESKEDGFIILSVDHYSPYIAKQWVEWLVEDINLWMKNKSISETKRNISYLENQLEKTSISEMKSVFYQLIEEQTKNLMLAEVDEEFSFKTIDPPVTPEEKYKPKRAVICILVTFLGVILSLIIVIIRFAISK